MKLILVLMLLTTTAFGRTVVIKVKDKYCDPGKKQIVLVNKSKYHWEVGSKVQWKTDLEKGKLKLPAAVKRGESLTIPITVPKPKKCKAKVKLP